MWTKPSSHLITSSTGKYWLSLLWLCSLCGAKQGWVCVTSAVATWVGTEGSLSGWLNPKAGCQVDSRHSVGSSTGPEGQALSLCCILASSQGEDLPGPVTPVTLVDATSDFNISFHIFFKISYFTIVCICEYLSVGLYTWVQCLERAESSSGAGVSFIDEPFDMSAGSSGLLHVLLTAELPHQPFIACILRENA